MTGDRPIVELHEVRKCYRGHRGLGELLLRARAGDETWALDGVSFTLERGRVLGVAGESGSGKSTLANILVGLEKPTSGKVLFDGIDLASLQKSGRRAFHRHVQMVFQDPYASLNPRFTVRRTVEEPLIVQGCPSGLRMERTVAALDQAELRPGGAFLDKYPHELSGGQRQRVAIARAIVLGPSVLVADEPVSMLDVSVRAGILRLLRSLIDRLRMSLVFITHDLSLIGQTCDEVAILYRGRIVEYGSAARVMEAPLHPYTKQLIAAVPVPDPTHIPAELPSELFASQAGPLASAGCGFAPRCGHVLDRCRSAAPELRAVGPSQTAACHRAEELRGKE